MPGWLKCEFWKCSREGNEFSGLRIRNSWMQNRSRTPQGLAILMDLLNPERIVIGSVFARSEALFREEMEKVIRKEALPLAVSVCRIVPAALGERIGDIACLALAGGMV